MAALRETLYLGRDNGIDLTLKADGVAVDLSSVTRMILRDAGCVWEVDSATSPGAFDWSVGDGGVDLILGDEPIPAGAYSCRLIVYDPTNTDGVVWDDLLRLEVVSICTVPPV